MSCSWWPATDLWATVWMTLAVLLCTKKEKEVVQHADKGVYCRPLITPCLQLPQYHDTSLLVGAGRERQHMVPSAVYPYVLVSECARAVLSSTSLSRTVRRSFRGPDHDFTSGTWHEHRIA